MGFVCMNSYDLYYYDRASKLDTRCVESFQCKYDLLKRMAEIKATRSGDWVFPGWDNHEEEA